MTDKALGYLAIASKAGRLITGADNCIDALKRNKASMIILASDASENALKRAEGMVHGRTIPLCRCAYTKFELACAVGANGSVAIAAICDKGLASAFQKCAAVTKQNGEDE